MIDIEKLTISSEKAPLKSQTTTMAFHFIPSVGILIINPPEGFKGPETIDDAKENLVMGVELSDGNLKGILAEMPNHYVNAETSLYYKKNVPDVPIALVANSSFKVMMGNFMLSLAKPKRPTALFKNTADAFEWLEQQIGRK